MTHPQKQKQHHREVHAVEEQDHPVQDGQQADGLAQRKRVQQSRLVRCNEASRHTLQKNKQNKKQTRGKVNLLRGYYSPTHQLRFAPQQRVCGGDRVVVFILPLSVDGMERCLIC